MHQVRKLFSSSALVLLLLLATLPSAAVAHGHDASAKDGDRPMTMADMESFPDLPSYWAHAENANVAYAHIALMVVSWVFILPLAVMLSVARSRLTLPVQVAFLVLNGFGILAGLIYNGLTPDLYEGNIHHTAGWILSCVALVWALLGVFTIYIGPRTTKPMLRPALKTTTREAMAEHQLLHEGESVDRRRWSDDSGHGTERNTESLANSSRTPSLNSETGHLPTRKVYFADYDDEDEEKRGFLSNKKFGGFLSQSASWLASPRAVQIVYFVHTLLERCMLLIGFFLLMSGIVTYAGVFRKKHIFNGMAHFVKGGIFFWYGLLTFGRWMGCFADLGWAWNIKPASDVVGRWKARIPSAEFTESFVIFLYGSTNVFLEHLAAWGQRWTAMDLEHVSITVMFFGGGLLGMLIESSRVRKCLLNVAFETGEGERQVPRAYRKPDSYVHSLNPVPGLVILLLGIMMSSHTQHSVVSGEIHRQWGTLFVGFALARGVTYVTLWLKPPKSYMPARPPSEIIASFCLISGGAIFMASNKDTVHALEQYHLDAMFVFTVMMGLTALLMAIQIFVTATKGWAVRREQRLSLTLPKHTTTD